MCDEIVSQIFNPLLDNSLEDKKEVSKGDRSFYSRSSYSSIGVSRKSVANVSNESGVNSRFQ
jgi:hypothetical protein